MTLSAARGAGCRRRHGSCRAAHSSAATRKRRSSRLDFSQPHAAGGSAASARGCGRSSASAPTPSAALADGSVDLIFSNLMLHWCDPEQVFAEFRRVLAPHGLLSFTSFGPDTLARAAQRLADRSTPTPTCISSSTCTIWAMHWCAPALQRRCSTWSAIRLTYLDVARVAADLKATGARNSTMRPRQGPDRPAQFAAMQAAYEHYRKDGRLPATYEVVFGTRGRPPAPPGAAAKRDRGIARGNEAAIARAAPHLTHR